MTIALGASTIATAAFPGSTTTTSGITTSASGSGFYVVVVTHGSTASTVSIADNKSNSYTHISQVFDTIQNYVDRFYCPAGTGGSGMTWSATLSPNNAAGIVVIPVELTGAAASSIFDSSSPAAKTGYLTPPISSNSFSAAPPSGGEMLLSILTTDVFSAGITFTIPTGFTLVQSNTVSSGNITGTAVAYQVITSNQTAQAVGWNDGSGNQYYIVSLDGLFGLSTSIAVPSFGPMPRQIYVMP